MSDTPSQKPAAEPEFKGPWYKHPYFLYVVLTFLIFAFLLGFAWVGVSFDLIPSRGIK